MAVDRALWRGLEKDPDRRWRSCCDMVEALEDGVIGTEAERTAPTRAAPTRAVPSRSTPTTMAPAAGASAGASSSRSPRSSCSPAPRSRGRAQRRRRRQRRSLRRRRRPDDGNRRAARRRGVTRARAPPRPGRRRSANRRPSRLRRRPRPPPPRPRPRRPSRSRRRPRRQCTTQEQAPPEQATPSGSSSELQAQGHNQIAQGDYAGAIASLQQAVQDCPVSQTDPCAYALYDLGHALRLAGRPSEAVDVLRMRLQNPDQQERSRPSSPPPSRRPARRGGAGPAGRGKGHANGRD